METPQNRRQLLFSLLGRMPPRRRPITAEVVKERKEKGYLLQELILDLNGIEPVPAYFVKSADAVGPLPALLYNHAHGLDYALGKEELIAGRPALQMPPYAQTLTGMGYAVLCIDQWVFGGRAHQSEADCFKEMLWHGRVLWGMMIHDSLGAVDYLTSRPEVDPGRVGTLGLSMGSTMAWWMAALDERLKVCIDLCCLTDFQALLDRKDLAAQGLFYYVPALLNHFSTAGINALIAPRPHLSLAGSLDNLTPPEGLDRIDAELKRVYADQGAPEAWKLLRYPVGHQETAQMRREVIRFLQKWLPA